MSVHPICLYPHPVLNKPTHPINKLTSHHHHVIYSLLKTLRVQAGGIGIAAPQIGYTEPIIIVDVRTKDKTKHLRVLINPIILKGEGYRIGREGCMSLPDYTGNVKRYTQIRLRWQDEAFKVHEITMTGIEAICIQHEVDHLNGKLFLDRVCSLARDVFRRKRYQ